MTNQFRTPAAFLIENTVYEECGEQIRVTHASWWLNEEAHADYLHKGIEAAVIVEGVSSSDKMAVELAKAIVGRFRNIGVKYAGNTP
jgi:hypothetical protein